MSAQSSTSAPVFAVQADKDQPLVDDIRLLGRILGDVIREQEGEAAFELVERDPPALASPTGCKRDAQAGRALDRLLKSLSRRPDGERDPRLQLLLAPRQHRRGPPPRAPARRARARRATCSEGSLAMALRARWRGAASAPTDIARDARRTPTSRRCSPRTRPRCSARASSTPSARSPSCSAARDAPAHASASCAAQRGAAPRPRHAALADAHAAHRQAHRRRRDRERAQLLPRHLPARRSRALPRDRGGAARPRDRALLPHGQLDRRRPRRQSQRHRRDAAHRAARGRARRRCATT